MLKKLIIFLIKKKLGVKEKQAFRFANQKSNTDYYCFINEILWKYQFAEDGFGPFIKESNVRLNWLLDDECKIVLAKGK
ncbi:MAG: hypothetical protein J6B01_04440 [Ruminococcus sp.]|nr:hypothetical protein [Ruminococcus sp.]